MNSSQRLASIVFLAAVLVVIGGQFVSGTVFAILTIVLVATVVVAFFVRGARRSSHSLLPILILLFIVVPIGMFSVREFNDVMSRKLPVFDQAVHSLQSSPQAADLLGAPIRISWPVKHSGTLSKDSGEARLSIPVRGSRSRGHATVDATGNSGKWTITSFELTQDGTGVKIDLREATAAIGR